MPLVTFALTALLGFVALAIEVGKMCLVRTELQRTADAAALAAVQELGGRDVTGAKANAGTAALQYVALNKVLNERPVDFDVQDDIVFGEARLDAAGTCIDFSPDGGLTNALRVTVRYQVHASFAKIFGTTFTTVGATATAAKHARDYMLVIDCSSSMTRATDEEEVAEDLRALGIPFESGEEIRTASNLTYEGIPPEFWDAYAIGEWFMPPSIRIQPLKATKDSAALSVEAIEAAGYDDQVGAIAFSRKVHWVEQLTFDYARIRHKLLGTSMISGTEMHLGMQAAREELMSNRARPLADKVMVILGDGRSDSDEALDEARLAAAEGITIHFVGLGPRINRSLIEEIVEIGKGIALYVEDTSDLEEFGPELEAAFNEIATKEVGITLFE